MSILEAPSPNFNDRAEGVALRYIVLHYTDMPSGKEALARLRDPAAEVSAHYLIEEDGRLYRLVPEEKRAWHAGQSFWAGTRDMNSASLGVELVNPGHLNGYRPFPTAQIDALKDLLRDILARRALDPARCLLGHSDIAPDRKQDPGELFPWRDLAAEGLGLWPAPREEDKAPAVATMEVFELLRRIGYGGADAANLTAFKRRYQPDALKEKGETPETLALLRCLARNLLTV